MKAIVYTILFLITFFTGCRTSYIATEKKSGFIEVNNQTEDETINKMIRPFRDSLTDEMETVIGISEMEMKTGQPESLLGNFVCDLVIQYNNGIEKQNNLRYFPTIVLMNYRGLRAPLPGGEIKVKSIFEIMPFENTLVFADLKGRDVLEMAKFLVKIGGQPVSSNFKLVVESDKSFQVTIDGTPIDTNATYTVITTDYLVNGGDNMSFFNKAILKTETNYKLRDLLMDQIKSNTKHEIKNTSSLDGRITFK